MNLLFGVHNHQPVGNFEDVFKKANQECYRPFVNILYDYPRIKATFHFSGSLIDWLLKNDPGLLEKVKEMLKRGQVEILTGGYYEPVLPVIPERDRIGQIDMLSSFIRDYFEYEPKGIWIGERVWEPHLVKTLARCGIKYTLLDEAHFRSGGMAGEKMTGYYITEEEGATLAVFPISERLRYTVPFSLPSEPIAYLKKLADEKGDSSCTIVDDGEKFGLWPGTHKWVYQERWLEKFFQLLIKNQDWLKTQTIYEHMQTHKPQGLFYLPCASYEKMDAWSGGFFRNFFSKYPEANNLHKRMLYVSDMLGTPPAMTEKEENKEARKHLYMGQCNCPYWHGVFGGIYLGHLRHVAYKNLITAQALMEKKRKPPWIETEAFDFDKDGRDELIARNPLLSVFIAPEQGGAILELDYMPGGVNLTDGMSRRPEAYHEKIKSGLKKSFSLRRKKIISIHDLLKSKEKGLKNFLIYDSYRRLSLLDHFFYQILTLEDFKNCRYEELGDFINAPYSVEQEKGGQALSIILRREGKINYHGEEIPLVLSKELSLNARDAQVLIKYNLENLSGRPIGIVFGVEFNISLESQAPVNNLRCAGEGGQRTYSLKEDVKGRAIERLSLQDATCGIETAFYFDKRPSLWAHPLETVSASESGFERNYQQTVILPCWPLRLERAWQTNIRIVVS
ncbi:MAG: DUF1926 domain-containing protein [Candidatus Omnitrophica bacterium]|nr:DUF1926 domain-containing protein [Candidatus Omnitrophota bacterium]